MSRCCCCVNDEHSNSTAESTRTSNGRCSASSNCVCLVRQGFGFQSFGFKVELLRRLDVIHPSVRPSGPAMSFSFGCFWHNTAMDPGIFGASIRLSLCPSLSIEDRWRWCCLVVNTRMNTLIWLRSHGRWRFHFLISSVPQTCVGLVTRTPNAQLCFFRALGSVYF